MKIKEQTRKLATDCSKHCFEVVNKTDGVSNIYLRQGEADAVWRDFRRVLLKGKHLSSSIVQKKKTVKPSLGLFFYLIFCELTVVEVSVETSLRH